MSPLCHSASRTCLDCSLIRSVARELYDDRFRFFFELLQNADDAKTKIAFEAAAQPCVVFTVKEKKMLVDLIDNEFRLRDVLAICSTGKSSKETSETIGSKGLGFKAVFGIARAVHIQSGPWSFKLQHRQGGDGIGMIAPIWQSPCNTLPRNGFTRITLTFDNEGENVNLVPQLCDWIEKQPVSIISFLKRIRKIEIHLDGADDRHKRILFQRSEQTTQGVQELIATIDGNRKVYTFREISQSATITTTESDDDVAAEGVILRFPISDQAGCEPLIDPDGQYTFTYLPIHQMPQLPFIVHANFSLTGSRQDVVSNLWNQRLKRTVAALFADAVETFVTEGPSALRFGWMEYLPATRARMTGFWNDLLSLIKQELVDRNVFVTYAGDLCDAGRARSLPTAFLHNDDPILPELIQSSYSYLSQEYDKSYAGVVHELGVRELSAKEMFAIISHDCQSTDSHLRTASLADPWHDSYAKLLKSLMSNGNGDEQRGIAASLREYSLIPVWTSQGVDWRPQRESIYFPFLVDQKSDLNGSTAVKVTIPTDLGFTLLHPKAAINKFRRKVYQMLGVEVCQPEKIQKAIFRVHSSKKEIDSRDEDLLAHFELLFWYEHSTTLVDQLWAVTVDEKSLEQSNRLLLRSDHPAEIASLVNLGKNEQYGIHFLNSMYTNSQVKSSIRGSRTWKEWLQEIAGVRNYPSLYDPDRPLNLHPLVVAVRDKSPASFLPMLQRYWTESYSATCSFPKIRNAVLESLVPCEHGILTKLRNAWFPSESILAEAQDFGVEAELPVLLLTDSASGCNISAWSALRDLGIPTEIDFAFYEQILRIMTQQSEVQEDKMCKLYKKMGSLARLEEQDRLKVRTLHLNCLPSF